MRVSVEVDRRAMRRPARVANADMAARRVRFQLRRQIIHATGRLCNRKLAFVDRGHTAAVVAAVFETAQPLDEKVDRLIRPDVSDDATHANPSCFLDDPPEGLLEYREIVRLQALFN